MIKEFVIPINKEDLFQSSSSRQYVVEQTYSKHELPAKLRGIKFYCNHFNNNVNLSYLLI